LEGEGGTWWQIRRECRNVKIFVDLEVLHEVVSPTEVLSAGGHDTFVGFFMGMNRPDVSFEVLSSEETLAASKDIASEHPRL
jgi:hypothetical protein